MKNFLTSRFVKSFSSKKTALYDFHVNVLKGKMIDFAFHKLPVTYPDGVMKEHLHCRESASIFDVSHMGQIKIYGEKATEFVETITVADVKNLKLNSSTLSLILNEQAGIIDDTIVTKTEISSSSSRTCERRFIEIIFHELDPLFNKWISCVDIEVRLHRSFRITLGEDGFEISVKNDNVVDLAESLLKSGVAKAAALGARDSLRLEAGLCLHGNDIDQSKNPAEAVLMWTVRKSPELKYIGYDALEAKKKDVKQKRVGFTLIEPGIARQGAELFNQNNEKIGVVSSGTYGPSTKTSIGMAYVNSEFSKVNTEIIADVKGKKVKGVISKMPFIPAKYYKPE